MSLSHKILFLIGLAFYLVACGGGTSPELTIMPTAAPTSTPTLQPTATTVTPPQPTATSTVAGKYVEFITEDNVRLAGTFYPAPGKVAVVFAHMGITDQTSWQGFAARLAENGMPALTFDFRCNGLSDCKGGNISYFTIMDIQAAIEYLRDQSFERIVCVGASMGSMACLNATLRENLAGLVFIAGETTYPLDNLSYPRDLVNPEMPKLFIVSENDRYSQVVTDTPSLYTVSPDPKQLVTFPSSLHGTELFDSEFGEQFSQLLLNFLLPINSQP
jgi:pimeloyl-ACP methyl ester carboxylesterase